MVSKHQDSGAVPRTAAQEFDKNVPRNEEADRGATVLPETTGNDEQAWNSVASQQAETESSQDEAGLDKFFSPGIMGNLSEPLPEDYMNFDTWSFWR